MGCGSSKVQPDKYKTSDFTVVKELGNGATCRVVSVKHKSTNKTFALKVLMKRSTNANDISFQKQMYNNEVKILQALDHPNVLHLEDHWEEDNSFNILTTLCTGGELFDRVKETLETKGRFTERDAATLIKSSLEAIIHCHSRNIVHRDLKPENFVFTTPEPNAPMLLIDFGCARIVTDKKVIGDVAGSAYYVSPEVLNDDTPRTGIVWKACDIWSIGIILYMLVCGGPPFDGSTRNKIFRKILKCAYKFPKNLLISDNVKDLIKNMLQRDYSKRLTAEECLKHPWFSDNADVAIDVKVIAGLQNFQAQCRLKRAVGRVMADRLTEDDKENLRAAFKEFDENGDGVLGPNEIAQMIKKIGRSDVNGDDFLKMMDEDGDGEINEVEFQAAHAVTQLVSEEDIKRSFDLFDSDGDGYVTHKEIEKVCDFLTPDAVRQLIQDVDTNGDGKVNFEEWLVAMCDVKSLTEKAAEKEEAEKKI